MGMYDGFLPKERIDGHAGYYPVTTAEEWDNLPIVYRAMEWFPVEVYNTRYNMKETTVAEYVEFDVTYMRPYKISATVRVHVQDVQKILFCYFKDTECHLYSVCGVVFANGERWGAKWHQDSRTGAYEIIAGGKRIGTQGGFLGFVPNQIERTDDGGWKWLGYMPNKNRCHYELLNPFKY